MAENKREDVDFRKVPANQALFVDYRTLSPYLVIDDLYNSKGGVSGKTGEITTRARQIGGTKDKLAYSYLNANPTENFYPLRVRNSTFQGDFRQYIDTKYKGVFKIQPKTVVYNGDELSGEIEGHPYIEWTKNMGGSGRSKNQFNQQLMASVYKDEVAFVVMDKPANKPGQAPIPYLQTASSVMAYDTDDIGGLIAITFVNQVKEKLFRMVEWTTTSVKTYESEDGKDGTWILVADKEIQWMPILAVFASPQDDPHDYLPYPKSMEIGAMCIDIYNAGSKLDWLIEKQAHDTFYTNADIDGVREGLSNILLLSSPTMEGAVSMGILSPDSSKVTVHQSRIDQKKEQLFQLMADGGVMVSKESGGVESGIAKAYSFAPLNDALLYTVFILSGVDEWMYKQYQMYMGGGEWTAKTLYRSDFSPSPRLDTNEAIELIKFLEDRALTDNAKHLLKMLIVQLNDNETHPIQGVLEEITSKYKPVMD